MRTAWKLGMVMLTAGILAGCGKRAGSCMTMAGSTAFQPFAEKLAEQYMETHPDVSITVQGGGSAVGVQSAKSGAAQIGMADLPELPPDAAELVGIVVARDGIVIIVNPANSVADLSVEQVKAIFSGTVANWKDVGGADAQIRVVSREAGSGTRTSFEKIEGITVLSKDALVQDSNGTIRETVANDVNAVGYLSHGLLNDKVKALTIGGAGCTAEEIKAGKYILVRPVFLMTKGLATEAEKDFIDYILSDEGQKTIHENGLLPVK